MIFELTEKLCSDILFAMEDQNNSFLVDARNGVLVSTQSFSADDTNYYALPKWNSSDGYALLESFTENLRSPMAHDELKTVLVSGRGVFRNFKNVLKSYPEVERKWHFFKNRKMNERVTQWYNSLREAWGLEKLENEEEEDIDELLADDFMFAYFNPETDWNEIKNAEDSVKNEYSFKYDEELENAAAELWQKLSDTDSPDNKTGFVCRTQSEDFAGCILFSQFLTSSKNLLVITDFFVLHNYRGCGIGRQLLSKSFDYFKSKGIKWILIANTIIPESMERLLSSCGFEKLGSGFVADLSKGVL